MCGRFTEMYTWDEIYAYYEMIDDLARNWPANYNVRPTQDVGTIRLRDGRRRFERMRRGLVPRWWNKTLHKRNDNFLRQHQRTEPGKRQIEKVAGLAP
jgi:putative SOS response-associated peptidase YedK